MTQDDIIELIKAFAQLLTVAVPVAIALIGAWKFYVGYADKRATAKELEHQRAMELKQLDIARAAANEAREDTQLQNAIDGLKMLATELGKMSTNQAKLIEVMQESQKQESERIALRKQELEKSHSDFMAISEEMKNYVRGVGELSGNLSDQLGKVALENRNSYQEALDKKVNEEHEQSAALIAELKAKLEKLEGYVEKDMLPILHELHESLNTLATKEDIEPVAAKLSELEARIAAIIKSEPPAPSPGAVQSTETKPDVPAQ